MRLPNRTRDMLLASAATGIAVMLGTGTAYAQNADMVETVVVTGFRASLQNTIAMKKDATQMVEAVSMEDVGKLPDQSIAEAISRLPGLTAQRLDGRAQNISIRGLSPDFSTTLLNGREQVSTSNNRSAQYDQYPSELMAGVVVYKTPTADLVGQGLSGTVDMRTLRPLDYDHRILSFNARGEGGDQGKYLKDMPMYGYRFSGTYVDQFDDGKLGVTVGIAHMMSPQQFLEYGSWGYADVGSTGAVASGGDKLRANTDVLTRTAALLTVQYRPNDHFESTVDMFYTKYKDKQEYGQLEFPLYSWGGDSYGGSVGLANGYTVSDKGLVTTGTYSGGVKAVVREEVDRHDNDMWALGWKNEYNSGNWTTYVDLNWSSVQRADKYWESYAGTGRNGGNGGTELTGPTDTISFTTGSDNLPDLKHVLNYGDYNSIVLTAPQNWGSVPGGQDGYLKYRTVHDYLTSARLNSELDLNGSVFRKLTVGFYYVNRHKSLVPTEYYADLAVDAAANAANGTHANLVIPENYRNGTLNMFKKFGINQLVTWDSEALLKDGYYKLYNRADAQFSSAADVITQTWSVDEMTYTGYAKADIDTDVAGIPVSGNVGLQVVETHQSSNGAAASTTSGLWAVASPVSGYTNYADFLPSFNLSVKPDDDSVIRLGAARELVRARMDQMSASNSYSYSATNATSTNLNNSPWGGSVGNPRLRPWMADAIDVSYEYYFAKDSYVSFAAFYKYLENYIYQKNRLFDFSGYQYSGNKPELLQGYVTQYTNGSGGNLQGVEFSAAVPGHLFSDLLEGFGLTFNASYTDSGIKQNGTQTSVPGLSKFVANATVYYETNGFSIRLNESYRSKFLGEVTGYAATLESNNINAQSWLDGQVGYTFQQGTLDGLSVLLQIENITNQTQVQYKVNPKDYNDVSRVIDWQRYGRTFLFGVTYKM